jgi:glycosyltransferase involved in cell wall biosynthesis
MIKVVHFQVREESAGRAALRLHNAFLSVGIHSTVVSLNSSINDDSKIKQAGKWSKFIALADHKLRSYLNRNNIKKFGLFSYPVLGSDVSKMEEVRNADFIYIHWALGGFLNLRSFEKLIQLGKPVIFFMHDMWNITGGCHHSFDCRKYEIHCYDCQIFPGHKKKDLSYKGFEKKKKLYTKYSNIYFVSPSKWLYNCAKKSALTKNKAIFHIPNFLDTTFFKPIDKSTAKKILNIETTDIVLSFGAMEIDSPYKGWKYLKQALEILKLFLDTDKITILIFGKGNPDQYKDLVPYKIKFIGFLRDQYSSVLTYNATDVFIAPSLAEAFGYVIFESLSCGTPVVSFNVGGIPDQISHKKNGYLAKAEDPADLADGIRFCLENNIKGYVLPELKPDFVIQKHLELFDYIGLDQKAKCS